MAAAPAASIRRVIARGVSKVYGRTVALRPVDVTLERATMTLIEGANGSGKSTLLGILGTTIKPTGGVLEHEPGGTDPRTLRAQIGWVSHESLSYPDLTGRQNIELMARLQGIDAGEAWARAEERFELGAFARRALRTCSRGQRQRVALAKALVHGPSLVLLDEPTAGLDKTSVSRLTEVVEAEVARGAAVVVVTHEPLVFARPGVVRLQLERGRLAGRTIEAPAT